MWEIIQAAGWPIWPLIIASIISLAIIGERFWTLRSEIVAPSNLLPEVQKWLGQGGVTKETLGKLERHSMLGQIFASALAITVIPEALPIITTFALSQGALRLARHKAVVKRLSS